MEDSRRSGGREPLVRERQGALEREPGEAVAPARRRPRRGWAWGLTVAAALVAAGTTGVAVLIWGPRDGAGRNMAGAASAAPEASPAGTVAHRPVRPPRPMVNGRRQPRRVDVPESASGRYAVVPGKADAPQGRGGPVVRYKVDVERGLPFRPAAFAAEVHRVLNDPRGWGRDGAMRFVRVSRGPVRFRVSLSSPEMVDRMCAPLITGGELSCRQGSRAVLNARRWGTGTPSYGRDVATYREYLVNHEVGHLLGHGHQGCPGPGRRAPVMVQQTKSLEGCRPNPWPLPLD